MEHFLERLARALIERHGTRLDHVAVVLPGRRAGIHLRNYLATIARRTIWSPELFDPGSFMARIGGMRQGQVMELLFMLYEAHRSAESERAEAMAEFLQWAPVTLRDISEIDAHLLDHARVYRDLSAYEELGAWSLHTDEDLSPSQARLVHQWARTRALHVEMERLMNERQVGTAGAVARKAAAMVAADQWRSPWEMVWFAGLNAVEPASRLVMQRMLEQGTAQVAWDADKYYLDDEHQEAGRFLRPAIDSFGKGVLPVINSIREGCRTIEFVVVANRIAQAYYAAERLASLSIEERAQTVVVLADENLLLPLLGALPTDIGPLNVTMGIPLKALPVHGLAEGLLDVHANAQHGQFLVRDIERLLLHPLLHQGSLSTAMIGTLRSAGSTRIDRDRVIEIARTHDIVVSEAMMNALLLASSPAHLHARIRDLIAWAMERSASDRFAAEQLFQLAKLERVLERSIARNGGAEVDLRAYRTIRERALRDVRLPLFGEPLAGLQIMGLLETRAIDHPRVIILGANEETLSPRAVQSWIPFDIRRHYKLPLRADTEAITAYHVHRLLHGAAELCLMHDPGKDGSEGPVRFAAQWEHELEPASNTRIHHRAVHAPLVLRHPPGIAVQKNGHVQERLRAMGAKGFTPTALGTWLRCPLDFYHTQVLGIRSVDDNEGELGSDVLGSAVHSVLENVYAPFVGKVIAQSDLLEIVDRIPEMLRARLLEHYPSTVLDEGHFRLSMEMAVQAITAYVQNEAQRCAVETTTPLVLETKMIATLTGGARIRGVCDRIEERNGLVHILDLKTGGVRQEDLNLKDLDRERLRPTHRYALQLIMYACMAFQNDPALARMRAGIIPLRRHSGSEGIWLSIGGRKELDRNMLSDMEALLAQLIAELCDPTTPFIHNIDSKWCTCCAGTK